MGCFRHSTSRITCSFLPKSYTVYKLLSHVMRLKIFIMFFNFRHCFSWRWSALLILPHLTRDACKAYHPPNLRVCSKILCAITIPTCNILWNKFLIPLWICASQLFSFNSNTTFYYWTLLHAFKTFHTNHSEYSWIIRWISKTCINDNLISILLFWCKVTLSIYDAFSGYVFHNK